MPASPASRVEEILTALYRSHERLDKLLAPMSEDELAADSFASEWSIAQVASHLGSGAEIFGLIVDAGVRGTTAPGHEAFAGVWTRWDAKDPTAQGRDALDSIGRFIAGAESLSTQQRERWQIDVFGAHFDLAGLLAMRLAEHVLHGWDIAVMADPEKALLDDEVPFVIDSLARLASRSGRTLPQAPRVRVVLPDLQRGFDLTLAGESPTLTPAATTGPDDAAARLHAPAEAFTRLVYGRLDADHTPDSVRADGIDLDTLRRAFPGP